MLPPSPTNPIRIDYEKTVMECFFCKSICIDTKDSLMRLSSQFSSAALEEIRNALLTDPARIEASYREAVLEVEKNSDA